MNYINPESLKVITAYVEPSSTIAKAGETLQSQRLGYFCVDPNSIAGKLAFNKTIGLKDTREEIKGE